MSKHKRLKAAKRKQHNKSAKARHQEWLDYCNLREQERARCVALAAEIKGVGITEPLPPTDPLSQLIEGHLDGSLLPAGLWHPNGTLDLYNIVNRFQHLAIAPIHDTEGPIREFNHAQQMGSDEPSA